QVRAVLDFDDDDLALARVLDPVPGAARNVDGLPGSEAPSARSHDDPWPPGDDHPVLCPESVLLKAQPAARLHHQALDLVAFSLVDGLEASPRAFHEGSVVLRRFGGGVLD